MVGDINVLVESHDDVHELCILILDSICVVESRELTYIDFQSRLLTISVDFNRIATIVVGHATRFEGKFAMTRCGGRIANQRGRSQQEPLNICVLIVLVLNSR